MEELDDYYLTLLSNEDSNVYFGNTSSSFTNKLPRPIILPSDMYEVGLTELIVSLVKSPNPQTEEMGSSEPQTAEDKSSEHQTAEDKSSEISSSSSPTLTQAKTFFNNKPATLTVSMFRTIEFQISKDAEELHLAVSRINRFFSDKKIHLVFKETIITETESKYTLSWKDDKSHKTLRISPVMCKALGFLSTSFPPGDYTAENTSSLALFQEIPNNFMFTFDMDHWEPKVVNVLEPKDYTIQSLAETLTKSFTSNKFKVSFLPSKTNTLIECTNYQNDIVFQFGSDLNVLLGIKEGFVFASRKTVIFIPEKLLQSINEKPKPTEPAKVVWNNRDLLLVQSGIVQDQVFGSRSLPVLRVVPLEATNTEVHKVFSPVHYLPLMSSELSEIQFLLTNSSSQVIEGTNSPTILTIHLRKRRI